MLKKFASISFTNHYEIILKIKDENYRWYYINHVANQFWTVEQLKLELKNQSNLQEQKLPNNFKTAMPDMLSNKAIRAFKVQYLLDYLTVEDANEEIDELIVEQGMWYVPFWNTPLHTALS